MLHAVAALTRAGLPALPARSAAREVEEEVAQLDAGGAEDSGRTSRASPREEEEDEEGAAAADSIHPAR